MKKIINKLILIFLILNILIITLIFVFARKKTQKIKISEDNLVKEMTISYKVHGNPLPLRNPYPHGNQFLRIFLPPLVLP